MKDFHPKSTKTMRAVEANMVLSECCESDCRMTIMIEKEEAEDGRKNRCTSCLMKSRLSIVLQKK